MAFEARVVDWNTRRECRCALHKEGLHFHEPSYDVRNVRYASEGAARPLKTDFSKLTSAQRAVLKRENDYWRDKPWAE